MDDLFLEKFFRELHDEPLEPEDHRCVPLHADRDVMVQLQKTIRFSDESTQLLSGYRGTGKSTELRRLRKNLQDAGYLVALIDIEAFLDLNTPVDIPDFLLALCGALGHALEDKAMLGKNTLSEGVWTRFTHWISSEIEIKELQGKAKVGGAELALKAELKGSPSFREQLQRQLAGSVGRLAEEARAFVIECHESLKKRHSEAAKLVVLVDSIEHARGTSTNEHIVRAGLERIFTQHDEKLRFKGVHFVYTVPPWLQIQATGVASLYDGEGLYILPTQKVRERAEGDQPGALHSEGIDRLVELVSKRGDWRRLLGERAVLERLILESGGHLRDLIRMLASIIIRSQALPASSQVVERAISALREQMLPIPRSDANWLARIAQTGDSQLDEREELGTLARYLDGHLVLSYRNGEAWYDVHPLVRDHVLTLASR